MQGARAVASPKPTEPIRRKNAEVREQLGQIDRWIDELPLADGSAQKAIMLQIVHSFRTRVLVHAEWEESVLYPAVDRRAGGGPLPFTASMRHDHTVAVHRLAEIDSESSRDNPDARWFARRADQLLGLLLAHLDAEERILLPVLDQAMTAEEYAREIGERSSPGS
jgi:iron-sulfur cluster repair protein YtfE (RIC family)